MRTLCWKLGALVIAGFIVERFGPYSSRYFLAAGLILTVVSVLGMLVFPVSQAIRSCLPARPAVVLFLPLFFLLLFVRSENELGQPPDYWFKFSAEEPDYDHRFLARVTVDSSISPGLYLAQVRIRRYQRDMDPSFHGESWKDVPLASASPQAEEYHPARTLPADSGLLQGRPAATGYADRNLAKQRLTKRTVAERGSAPKFYLEPGRVPPFLTAISIDNNHLYPGCELTLQVFGRGVPERPYGGFGEYLKGKGAESYLRVYKKWHVLKTECPDDVRADLKDRLFVLLGDLSEPAEQITRAMLLGESGWMDREIRNRARRLGIMHLFAASGLHLGIFYGVFFFPLSLWLGRKHPLALFLPLIPCAMYLWALYFPVSLSRAFVFILLLAVRSVVHRKVDIYNHLANTGLLLVLWNPMDFFSLSGYLSFGAVTGILIFYKPLQKTFLPGAPTARSLRWLPVQFLVSQLALSLSASMFITPLLIWTFHEYPFSSHMSNVILVPFTALILPPIYLLLCIRLEPALDTVFWQWLWQKCSSMLELFAWLTRELSRFSILFEYETPLNFAFFLSLLILACLWPSLARSSRVSRFSVGMALCFLALGAVLSILLAGDRFWGNCLCSDAMISFPWRR